MLRTLHIALFSALLMAAACKKDDKPAETKPAETTTAVEPAKPTDPAVAPADPAKPADPVAKPAEPAVPASAGKNNELETKGIAMMHQMGDMFAANAKDCEKLAAGIKTFIVQNRPLLEQLAQLEKTQSDAEKKAFAERNLGAQEEVMKKMTPGIDACGENASVMAAMKEFPTN
jgi:hypothetical protein